jgi:hypothetical protein
MKVITILGLTFLAIILVFVLPRKIEEYNLMKSEESVTVKVTNLPNCSFGYKNKFIHISYNDQIYIVRTQCKYVSSLVVGQQIKMLHKADTEIFLFANENATSELMTTILLAIFMTLCLGILVRKHRITNPNAHNTRILCKPG